jgi:hypothetical protein
VREPDAGCRRDVVGSPPEQVTEVSAI